MKRVTMVTGAGGFLGSHVVEHFLERGDDVIAVGRFAAFRPANGPHRRLTFAGMTLPDRRFADVVRTVQPTLLVHCAGTASVPASVAEPYVDFQRTVDVSAFTLETLRRHAPACHFVLLSSAAVYGNPSGLPVAEDAATRPISPYGYHKLLCEMLAEEAAVLHGMRVSILRIFSAFGEGQRKQVVFDIFRKFTDTADDVELYGTGEETRDFIHARDIAACVETLANAAATGTYNLASGQETTIAQLATLVGATLGARKTIRFTGARRAGDPVRWRADVRKLAALGFVPRVSLPQGLEQVARWLALEERAAS